MRTSTSNYAKSFSISTRETRYFFFNDRQARGVALAKQWLDMEAMAGRQVSIFRRPEGLARGYLDDVSLIGDLGDL